MDKIIIKKNIFLNLKIYFKFLQYLLKNELFFVEKDNNKNRDTKQNVETKYRGFIVYRERLVENIKYIFSLIDLTIK